MADKGRQVRDWLAKAWQSLRNSLSVLLIVILVGALISSEAGRGVAERQSHDYHRLWNDERTAHRRTIFNNRVAELEARISALPEREVRNVYQNRLADVRQHFDRVVRGTASNSTAPACPTVPVQVAAAAARPDEPARCTMTETHRETAERLAKLQQWVREHTQ